MYLVLIGLNLPYIFYNTSHITMTYPVASQSSRAV